MSVINISFDTKTKVCLALMDGFPLCNVDYINIHKDYDDPKKSHIILTLKDKIEQEDVIVYTNIEASKIDKKNTVVKSISDYNPVDTNKLINGAYAIMGKKPPK